VKSKGEWRGRVNNNNSRHHHSSIPSSSPSLLFNPKNTMLTRHPSQLGRARTSIFYAFPFFPYPITTTIDLHLPPDPDFFAIKPSPVIGCLLLMCRKHSRFRGCHLEIMRGATTGRSIHTFSAILFFMDSDDVDSRDNVFPFRTSPTSPFYIVV
jgi:hypothetical protein